MPHQAPLQPGDPRRVGRYRIAGRITGVPADGPIYLGTGPDGAEVAISMLRTDWASDGAARDRFAAEAAVAKRVPPFCAARILDSGLEGADAYLVSEYVPGRSLLEIVSADGVLDPDELEAAAIGMATGLASIHHAGLVHGNFGPEYVIMTAAGPRVVEFGITPPYGTATPAADMLAWAQTVAFAASGKPPATMADLEALPGRLRDLVADCLGPDPGGRPAARSAVLELLGEDELPAGVLAEGSRRAAPGGGLGVGHTLAASLSPVASHPAGTGTGRAPGPGRPPGASGPRRQHPGPPVPALEPVVTRSGPMAGAGRAPSGTAPRPVSRHSRPHDEPGRHPAAAADWRGGHQQRPGRGSRTVLIVAGAVVACVLVVLVVMHVLGGKSPPVADSGQTSRTNTPPPRSPSAAPTSPAVIPAAFAGTWSGTVHQPPNDTYLVTVSLPRGTSSGTVTYSTAGVSACSPSLTVMQVTGRQLTLAEAASGSCSPGTVTIALGSGGTADFSFRGGGPSATGTLAKS
jgi:hypothetical protein